MIREVYINNQLIDIEAGNVSGYIFYSPIFRDISKIVSNRTTTYKIPKTTKNLSILGLADNPDVNSLAPYREHTFKEDRDGLPFIEGVCHFLKTSEKELELVVFWGNSEKLQSLKDVKLRDLRFKREDYIDEAGNEEQGYRYIYWGEGQGCLAASSTSDSGFLKIDFGRGVNDLQYIHPSVNIQYILNLIKSSTGITIGYPGSFQEEFKKKWFPLVDKSANSITWDSDNYRVRSKAIEAATYDNQSYSIINFSGGSNHILETDNRIGSRIKAKAGATIEFTPDLLQVKGKNILEGTYELKLYLGQGWSGEVYAEQIVDTVDYPDGKIAVFSKTLSFKSSRTEDIFVKIAARKKGTDRWQNLNNKFDLIVRNGTLPNDTISVKYEEVQFGDKYPIINNLPDISVLDFLKSLMSMYGLFTYHNFTDAPDTVEFVSIDEMYSYKYAKDNLMKYQACDWTNKLLSTNGCRMKLEYTYGEYAQKNYLRYKNDKDVTINANGFIQLDNNTLPKEKDLIEVPYSPSNNTADEYDNKFAKIPIYDSNGNYSSVGVRILTSTEYQENSVEPKFAWFDEGQHLSNLIKKYYSKYQAVLEYPVVVECSVYLSDVELNRYRETTPIYIDGVYYMPITVTVQTNGIANCKAIKMPPEGKYFKPSLMMISNN